MHFGFQSNFILSPHVFDFYPKLTYEIDLKKTLFADFFIYFFLNVKYIFPFIITFQSDKKIMLNVNYRFLYCNKLLGVQQDNECIFPFVSR